MAVQTAPATSAMPCPGNDDLRKLLRGKHGEARQQALEAHLDDCTACRNRLELMADADTNLSDMVRHIDRDTPRQNSAYWKALNNVEREANVTATFATLSKTPLDGAKTELDFLKPSDDPKYLGTLGNFNVMQEIGRGGMGVVLRALDPHLDREVAIKVLDPQMASNTTARERFCRESRAAASVTHDHLVTVFQVNEDEHAGLPYLVMQLIKGESLEEKIRREGKLSIAATVRYALHAAQGLAAAHAAKLIHRDIKPANILIEESTDKASLTDFGLARAAEDAKLTRTGFVAGTPLYMAPEQARGEEADARADLFSLGAVMYEALAGKPPFEGNSALAVLRRVADEAHPRLRRLNPQVPAWLEDVIDHLLEKKPENRIASAEELSRILADHYCSIEPDGKTPAAVECTVARSASRFVGRRNASRLKVLSYIAAGVLMGALGGALATLKLSSPTVIDGAALPRTGNSSNASLALPAPGPGGPEPYRTLDASTGAVWSVAGTAHGEAVLAGIEDGSFILWNLDNRKRLISGADAHQSPILAVDLSSDGSRIVTAGDDGMVHLWDAAKATKPLKTFKHLTSVRSVAMNRTGTSIITGDRAGMVRIWSLDDDTAPMKVFEHAGTISAVAFAPDSLSAASVSTNKTVKIWEVPSGNCTFTFNKHEGPIYSIAYSADGNLVATGSWDKTVMIWEPSTGTVKRRIAAHDDGVVSVSFTSCGGYLATGAQDGVVKLWNADGVELAKFSRHKGSVHSVRFLPECHYLVSGGRDGYVYAWDVTPYLPKK